MVSLTIINSTDRSIPSVEGSKISLETIEETRLLLVAVTEHRLVGCHILQEHALLLDRERKKFVEQLDHLSDGQALVLLETQVGVATPWSDHLVHPKNTGLESYTNINGIMVTRRASRHSTANNLVQIIFHFRSLLGYDLHTKDDTTQKSHTFWS